MTAITLLAFGLRGYRLDFQSLRGDEAASATYASLPAPEILEISRVADPHPPLFYLVLGAWERLAGPSEFAVRFWVLLPGVLVIPSLYGLARRLAGRQVAILAALLLAINSFHIWHSQDVRSYTWFALLGVWSALLLCASLEQGRRRDWGLYTLTLALLFYLHYYSVFLVIFHGLYVLWTGLRRKPRPVWLWVKWGGAIFLAGLALVPWLSLSWRFIARFTGDFDPALPHLVLWRGLQAFSGGPVSDLPRLSPSIIALILLASVGLWVLWRSRKPVAIFLALYLAFPFLGVMALTLRGQAFTERYLIAALPAYLILMAAALAWLWSQRVGWRQMAASLGVIIALGVNILAITQYQTNPGFAKSPQWRQAFDYITNAQNPATDLLIYNFPEAAITYYLDTNRPNSPPENEMLAVLVPDSPNPSSVTLDRQMRELLAPYERVWFVPVGIGGWDDERQVETWLTRHADRVEQTRFHWARTDLYLTPAEIARSMHIQQLDFAGGITLRGFRVFNKIPAGQNQIYLTPEEPLDFSLYWRAQGPTDFPLTVFTQLIDAGGFFRGGQDNQPVWGTYPTTAWRPGEQITDKYHLSLQPGAPPGQYQVWVGFYNSQTGRRVMVLDEAGNPVADHAVLTMKVIVE